MNPSRSRPKHAPERRMTYKPGHDNSGPVTPISFSPLNGKRSSSLIPKRIHGPTFE
jgi:hypothetical protein